MKLISLNTWGGRAGKEELLEFFRKHKDVDIFCLQEIWEGGDEVAPRFAEGIDTAMISNIGNVLKDHTAFFRPHYGDYYGLAMFVKKDLKVAEEGELFVYKERGYAHPEEEANHARNIQWLSVETKTGARMVANFHGIWNGQGKNDSEDRLLQSDKIIKFLNDIKIPHVLCGDFNLRPDTQSLKKFEEFGFKNLIKEFGITTTRSSHYKKPEKFADYTLVSSDIKVNDFKVLPDEVSDHLAMYLDFE